MQVRLQTPATIATRSASRTSSFCAPRYSTRIRCQEPLEPVRRDLTSAPESATVRRPRSRPASGGRPMRYRYYTCDVFTAKRFGGNPLAVLPEATGLSGEAMQRVAREFNYSETTFVLPPDDPTHTRKVRIFTPGAEIPFAGHPNIGTAFVLAAIGAVPTAG